jgi:hypothetical protein
MNSILEPLSQVFTEGEKQHEYFQQNARAHASQQSVAVLREIFGEKLISRGLWVPGSPDFCM